MKPWLVRITLALLAGTGVLVQAADNLIEVSRGIESAPLLVVQPFAGSHNQGDLVNQLLRADLGSTGDIKLADLGEPETSALSGNFNYEKYAAIGVDYVLATRVDDAATGGVKIEFIIHNISEGEPLLRQALASDTRADVRNLAHKYSNRVYKALTDRRGAFDTFVAYIRTQIDDGEKLYQIVIAHADGYAGAAIFSSSYPIYALSWSPDSKQIAYTSWEEGQPLVYVQELATGKRVALPRSRGLVSDPVFSPDGKSIAMVISDGFNPDIHLVDLASLKSTQITSDQSADVNPSFSPSGNKIIYTSNQSGSPQLYEVTVKGKEKNRITFQGGYNADGIYMPDGESVAAVMQDKDGYRVTLINMASLRVQYLTNVLPEAEDVTVSPNGAVILFAHKDEQGQSRISGISHNGQVTFRLSTESGEVYAPAWSPFTLE